MSGSLHHVAAVGLASAGQTLYERGKVKRMHGTEKECSNWKTQRNSLQKLTEGHFSKLLVVPTISVSTRCHLVWPWLLSTLTMPFLVSNSQHSRQWRSFFEERLSSSVSEALFILFLFYFFTFIQAVATLPKRSDTCFLLAAVFVVHQTE